MLLPFNELGRGKKLIQDNVLWKPPGGKTLGYHQDAAYDDWIVPQTMMTCWMSLDVTSKATGTLEYVKGSHKWGLQPPKGEFHSPNEYKKTTKYFLQKKIIKKIDIAYVEVPAGGVSFHHGYTWHGFRHKYISRSSKSNCCTLCTMRCKISSY